MPLVFLSQGDCLTQELEILSGIPAEVQSSQVYLPSISLWLSRYHGAEPGSQRCCPESVSVGASKGARRPPQPPMGSELTCPYSPLLQIRHRCHSPASEELFLIFPGVREPSVPMPSVAKTIYYDGHFNPFSLENVMQLGFPPAYISFT